MLERDEKTAHSFPHPAPVSMRPQALLSAARGVPAAVTVAIDAIAGLVGATDEGTGDTADRSADRSASDIIRYCATDNAAGGRANCRSPFRLRAGGQGKDQACDDE